MKKEILEFNDYKWKLIKSKKRINKNSLGFTNKENKCHNAFMNAFKLFNELDKEHPTEADEMVYAIHLIQGILAMRAVRRSHKGWATYKRIKRNDE